MCPPESSPVPSPKEHEALEPAALGERINDQLKLYSDKDWNYSRISLETRALESLDGPYVLWIDFIETRSKRGKSDFQTFSHEVTWGARHSAEIGILELISLRINKAMLELTNVETWDYNYPVIRLVKKEDLVKQGIKEAFWYRVTEVIGEEFDNR